MPIVSAQPQSVHSSATQKQNQAVRDWWGLRECSIMRRRSTAQHDRGIKVKFYFDAALLFSFAASAALLTLDIAGGAR